MYTYMGGCQNYGPLLVLMIIRHLVFMDPEADHNFDNHPHTYTAQSFGLYNKCKNCMLDFREQMEVSINRGTQNGSGPNTPRSSL